MFYSIVRQRVVNNKGTQFSSVILKFKGVSDKFYFLFTQLNRKQNCRPNIIQINWTASIFTFVFCYLTRRLHPLNCFRFSVKGLVNQSGVKGFAVKQCWRISMALRTDIDFSIRMEKVWNEPFLGGSWLNGGFVGKRVENVFKRMEKWRKAIDAWDHMLSTCSVLCDWVCHRSWWLSMEFFIRLYFDWWYVSRSATDNADNVRFFFICIWTG